MAKATKQQIAQAKARAGGNNPIKVTKAGVKRLGQGALIASSFTPVGRAAKVAGMAAKAAKTAIKNRKTVEVTQLSTGKTIRLPKQTKKNTRIAPKATMYPKSAVKVIPPLSPFARTLKNSGATLNAVKAASGQTAREGAFRRNLVNQASKEIGDVPKTVKVRGTLANGRKTNPVLKISNTPAAKRARINAAKRRSSSK